jgi:hypothetical protein
MKRAVPDTSNEDASTVLRSNVPLSDASLDELLPGGYVVIPPMAKALSRPAKCAHE